MSKYPTAEEIAEMKARGYEVSTIEAAKERAKRWEPAQRLCELIREAFSGVTLGNGVGLAETTALDDYADEATCAAIRANDEKEDWQRIPIESLNGHTGVAFFDAEGMRFHLPALLIADLRGDYNFGMTSWLTGLDEWDIKKFALLSDIQRHAVREYLLFVRDDPNEAYYSVDIDRALETYWT